MFRLILMILVLIPFFLVATLFTFLFGWIIGLFSKKAQAICSLRVAQTVFRLGLFLSGTKVTVIGRENLLKEPVVYAGNHRSQFDILNCLPFFPCVTGFVTKIEMKKVPLIGHWVKILHGLFVDRGSVRSGLDLISNAVENIKKRNDSLIFFCEGRLNKTDEPTLRFKGGAFNVAAKAGCPIIPMTQNNTAAAMAHVPFFHKTHTIIEFGKPIYTKNLSEEELKELPQIVEKIVAETYVKNKTLV